MSHSVVPLHSRRSRPPQQADGLRTQASGPARGDTVAVLSGKGGVGKTNLVANLAVAIGQLGGRSLVVDGDLGLANADLVLGLTPRHHVGDVLCGRCDVSDALCERPPGVMLLAADSARSSWSALPGPVIEDLLDRVVAAADAAEAVWVDAGAGIGPSVIGLARACSHSWVVLHPEPTSLADAYATCKLIWRDLPGRRIQVVVNGARHEEEARLAFERLQGLTQRFLGGELELLAVLPFDPRLGEAVRRQRPVVELDPSCEYARSVMRLAERWLRARRRAPRCGVGR